MILDNMMEQKKNSKAFWVASIVSLVISGLGIVSLVMVGVMSIGLVKKYFRIIWMPILSMVLGMLPFLGGILLLIMLSA